MINIVWADAPSFKVDRETGLVSVFSDNIEVIHQAAPKLKIVGKKVSAGKLVSLTKQKCCISGLGWGEQQQAIYRGAAGELILELTQYEGKPYLTVCAKFTAGEKRVEIEEIYLLDTGNDGGLLYASSDGIHILENGHDLMNEADGDTDVRLLDGRFESDSNWNHAIYNVLTGRALVAGFLTHEHALTHLQTNTKLDNIHWAAACLYSPPKKIKPREQIVSELLYLDLATGDPFAALEGYADRIAAVNDITPWPVQDIQAIWDSWNTHYYTHITEKKMLENARWVAQHLRPYGMHWFGIDDGYQIRHGDWRGNADWPNGMSSFADSIHAMDLKAAIWIAPFVVHAESEIATNHPEWILDVYEFAEIPSDWRVLDTSRSDVQQWLEATARRITYDWGFDSLNETDYVYLALFGKTYFNDMTRSEAYRAGIKAFKRGCKPGTYVHGLNPCGLGWGLNHGVRTGNDTSPHWQSGEHWSWGPKNVAAMAARRYYLNHRVYLLDPDAFYFAHPATIKRWKVTETLSLETSKAWATLVGLQGGITKVGDAFINLLPEEVAVIRKVLPPTGVSARPLDLFLRQYPRLWQLWAQTGNPWQVLAIFDWDEPGESGALILEAEQIGLEKGRQYVAYDFWNDRAFVFTGTLNADPPKRECQLLAIHPSFDRPQYISTDRHVTQGTLTLGNEHWDDHNRILYGEMKANPKTEQALMFYLPSMQGGDNYNEPVRKTFSGADVLEIQTQPVFSQNGSLADKSECGIHYTINLAVKDCRISWRLEFK